MFSNTNSFFVRYAVYAAIFLLALASFLPIESHMICGACPTDANSTHGGDLLEGQNGQCSYCSTNHSNHIYEEPPEEEPPEEEPPGRTPECIAARKAYRDHLEYTAAVCTVGLIYPKAKVACVLALARVPELKWEVIKACGFWDSGV